MKPLLVAAVVCVGVLPLLAQGRTVAPRPTLIDGGKYEASGIVAIPGTRAALFVADGQPKHVFWMEFDPNGAQVGRAVPVPLGLDVPDPEDITTDGTHFYVVGSQSQGGRHHPGLVRFDFDTRTHKATQVQSVTDLSDVLAELVPDLGAVRRGVNTLNIEGITWDPARSRLWLGLRSPMSGATAVLIPLTFKDPKGAFTAANIALAPGGVVHLTLGGLAIRGLGYDAVARRILVMAGASTYADASTFRLLEWDGVAAMPSRELARFPPRQKPEGVTKIALGGQPRTLVVFDTGGFMFVE